MAGKNSLVAQASRYREEMEQKVSDRLTLLANRRLLQLGREFRRRYPKRRLVVTFNGPYYSVNIDHFEVEFDHRQGYNHAHWQRGGSGLTYNWWVRISSARHKHYHRDFPLLSSDCPLAFIWSAMEDVKDITDTFTNGWPSDLVVTRNPAP